MKDAENRLEDFENALLKIDRISAASIFRGYAQVSQGDHPVEQIVVEALERIGKKWELGAVSLAQVYMSGRICEELIDEYLPKAKVNRKESPRIAIALLIDRHALGKKIVSSLLRAAGYEVTDFGDGLTPEQIAGKTIANRIEILLISTLMYLSALKVKELRSLLEKEGYPVKIFVGGAPFRFDERLWETVGADAGSRTASDVFHLLEYLGEGKEALR